MGGSCSRKRNQNYASSRVGQGSELDYDYGGGLGGAGTNMFPSVYGGMNMNMYGGTDRNGYGAIDRNGYGYGSTCPDGVDQDTALLVTAAGIAVGAAVLFRAITLQQAGRKRRSADLPGQSAGLLGRSNDSTTQLTLKSPVTAASYMVQKWANGMMDWNFLYDKLWTGLEEFEEKIERLGQAEEKKQEEEGGSWINSILKELLRVKQETEEEMKEQEDEAVDDAADEDDLEKIEPPLLDMSWTEDQQKLQTIVDEQVAKKRIKRSVETKNKKLKEADIQESCKIKIWRCMSGVLESGVKYIEKPGGIMGAAKQVLFKIAFHGGLSNPWTSLMTIPEARRVARCMRDHDSCVTNQILADQVDNQVVGKRRVLVNPEFVQGLDSSDGQFQYNKEIADLMYDN